LSNVDDGMRQADGQFARARFCGDAQVYDFCGKALQTLGGRA